MMNDLLKNPFTVLVLLIAALFAVKFVFSLVVNLFWLVIIAAVAAFFINARFRKIVTKFFRSLFIKD